ncbi:MAG: ATP phosphoribosyltransferase [Aquificae bacterium]|nr:ATP phosphoribosyltransferase [Aquificota bacterium]
MLKLALPKGRLFEESVELLKRSGIINEPLREGRKLIVEQGNITFYLVKPSDVPVYVEGGVADVGICGYDVYLEKKPDVYKLLDLGIGFCRLAVAGKPESEERYFTSSHITVATKYPNIAKEFFRKKGVKADIYYLSGSVELAPLVGLSEFILDLVQTGRTLKENGLILIEEITHSTAWLIANKDSFRAKNEEHLSFLKRLKPIRTS